MLAKRFLPKQKGFSAENFGRNITEMTFGRTLVCNIPFLSLTVRFRFTPLLPTCNISVSAVANFIKPKDFFGTVTHFGESAEMGLVNQREVAI